MIIEINKDLDGYQESLALGLTARQFAFSALSVLAGGGIVLLLYRYVGLTIAAYVAIPCVAPIALGGFYSFNGMNFYEYARLRIYFAFQNRVLTYRSTEGPGEAAEAGSREGEGGEASRGFEAAKRKMLATLAVTLILVIAAVILVIAMKGAGGTEANNGIVN